MQRLKRAIKRIATIGTGIAFLGATMTSALALDLSEYPAPFVDTNGVFDESTAIVVGAAAAAADTLGAVDIATNLQYMAKTAVTTAGATVSVVGGESEEIPISKGIADANVGIDWQLDDSDVSSFQDTSITFQSKDYDVHDELDFSTSSPSIETSLTSLDDDYETAIVMEVARDSIRYFYAFDEAINVSKATSSEPLEIKFLGKTIKITNTNDKNNQITAYVGAEYFMDVGDTVTVDGKKVTLQNVGSGGAIVVDVDGEIETIPADGTETVNGIEIHNDETFYEDVKSERSGSLVIGEDAVETYTDGDAYVGEDENNPDWVWNLDNLGDEDATTITAVASWSGTSPIIGIENDFVMNDDSDNPPQVGDCIDLPNNYASICMDSLTVADTNYATYTIEYESDSDLSDVKVNGNALAASFPTIYIHTAQSEGLAVDTGQIEAAGDKNASISDSIKTEKIWLARVNITGQLTRTNDNIGVFYEDTNGKTRFAGEINATSAERTGTFAQVNFDDTTGTSSTLTNNNINLNITWLAGGTPYLIVTARGDTSNDLAAGTDDIIIKLISDGNSNVNFSGLGDTASTDEAEMISWGSWGITTNTTIGTKDEDHRTIYGIIIRDPKNHGGSDEVVLDIPGDQVKANIVVKGTTTTVAGGATSYIPADITVSTKLDTEIVNPANHQLILVGGPCADPLVEKITGLPKCADWALAPGEALLKLVNNDGKVALLVAGTDAIDTRMAAKVVANYEDYALETTEQVVTGTLSAPTIKVS